METIDPKIELRTSWFPKPYYGKRKGQGQRQRKGQGQGKDKDKKEESEDKIYSEKAKEENTERKQPLNS